MFKPLKVNSNIYMIGYHPSGLGPRNELIQNVDPDLILVDKPQDLLPYAMRVLNGEDKEIVGNGLYLNTFMNPNLFKLDCSNLMEFCNENDIKDVHLIGIPHYISNVAPYYLDNKFGDQTTQEGIMSLRLKETSLQNPDKKIVMLIGDTLLAHLYQKHEKYSSFSYEDIQEKKGELADKLTELLKNEMKSDPISLIAYTTTKNKTNDLIDNTETGYFSIINRIMSGERDEKLFNEAKQMSDMLSELRFSSYKLNYDPNKNQNDQTRLLRAKRQLDENIFSGQMKTDLLEEITKHD